MKEFAQLWKLVLKSRLYVFLLCFQWLLQVGSHFKDRLLHVMSFCYNIGKKHTTVQCSRSGFISESVLEYVMDAFPSGDHTQDLRPDSKNRRITLENEIQLILALWIWSMCRSLRTRVRTLRQLSELSRTIHYFSITRYQPVIHQVLSFSMVIQGHWLLELVFYFPCPGLVYGK